MEPSRNYFDISLSGKFKAIYLPVKKGYEKSKPVSERNIVGNSNILIVKIFD